MNNTGTVENNPRVSIIIPVYNAEASISRCIEHIVCQSYNNIEIIIVNDGSTDSSAEICLKWAERDSRITLINQSNSGPSSARNAGYKGSTGSWLWFVDSDDTMAPEAVETLVTEATARNSDVAVCNFKVIIGNNTAARTKVNLRSFPLANTADSERYLEDLLSRSIGNYIWQFLIKRSVIESFGEMPFDENLTLYEDVIFSLKLALFVKRFVYVDHICYSYFMTEGSLIHTKNPHLAQQSLRAVEFLENFQVPGHLATLKLERYLTLLLGTGIAAGTGPDARKIHTIIKKRISGLRRNKYYRGLGIKTKLICILVACGLYWKLSK